MFSLKTTVIGTYWNNTWLMAVKQDVSNTSEHKLERYTTGSLNVLLMILTCLNPGQDTRIMLIVDLMILHVNNVLFTSIYTCIHKTFCKLVTVW